MYKLHNLILPGKYNVIEFLYLHINIYTDNKLKSVLV